MRFVWARWGSDLNRHFWQWASLKLFDHLRGFGPCSTMGVFDGEKLIAVMVYHNYDDRAGVVEISGAADDRRWLKRHILCEMFDAPFRDMDCQSIVMRVSPKEHQKHLHRMLHALSFKSFILPRLRGRDEDETVFVLHDDAWRDNRFNRKELSNEMAGTGGKHKAGTEHVDQMRPA